MGGPALELITGTATAPGSTFTALTGSGGNTFTVRSAPIASNPLLLTAWANNNAAGEFRIRSARLHDFQQGIRMQVAAATPLPIYPTGYSQKLVPQDTLVAEITGSATGGQIETGSMLIFYPDLPGVDARLADPVYINQHMVNVMGVSVTLTFGTVGGYTGQVLVTNNQSTFKANTDYALLGYTVTVNFCCVRIQGVDTGNLGVGGPAFAGAHEITSRWFVWLSEKTGLPCIPIFNSANQGTILVDGAQTQAGTASRVSLMFAELR
jgi:hypothetical protein